MSLTQAAVPRLAKEQMDGRSQETLDSVGLSSCTDRASTQEKGPSCSDRAPSQEKGPSCTDRTPSQEKEASVGEGEGNRGPPAQGRPTGTHGGPT